MKCPRLYLCLAHFHFISFSFSILQVHQCNRCIDTHMNDMIQSISSHDLVVPSILDLARFSPLLRSIGAKSCSSFTASRSITLKPWLALHHCNQSIKPSLVLIFSTLVTWLHVMSHMQYAPYHYLWTNHMCISPSHIISPPNVVTQLPKPNKDLSLLT